MFGIVLVLGILLIGIGLLFILIIYWNVKRLVQDEKLIGFMHPACLSGGGGERVLWTCIKALQESGHHAIVVYCNKANDSGTAWEWRRVKAKVMEQFNINVKPVQFVDIGIGRRFVDLCGLLPFTLLLQSMASSFLILVGFFRGPVPTIYFETTGYPFTYPMAFFAGCNVITYVHYPTISSDMIQRVRKGEIGVNNRVALSGLKGNLKLIYYQIFAWLYSFCGKFCSLIFVNSTWTRDHIVSLWGSKNVNILYPPVDVSAFSSIKNPISKREKIILSIGQFRPEKNHTLQVKSFSLFIKSNPNIPARLVLLGSCRNEGDRKRIDELKRLVHDEKVDHAVDFKINASFSDLKSYLEKSFIGLHTMIDEHFGICVVEYQAAGLITIAHNSAGPKFDIIDFGKTGFLAATSQEYSELFQKAFLLNENELEQMSHRSKLAAHKFSEDKFIDEFLKLMQFWLKKTPRWMQ